MNEADKFLKANIVNIQHNSYIHSSIQSMQSQSNKTPATCMSFTLRIKNYQFFTVTVARCVQQLILAHDYC